jgi:hypothetical protein
MDDVCNSLVTMPTKKTGVITNIVISRETSINIGAIYSY